jgi:hypothetical protein
VYFSSRFYVTVGAAATQYLVSQNITPSMWFMLTAHFLYANACMKVGNCLSVWGIELKDGHVCLSLVTRLTVSLS